MKVASITSITIREEFMEWLDKLPFHITERMRKDLWEDAKGCKSVVWIKRKEAGDDFYFWW